jgi:ASC-1-like (ASCH) protein
MDCKREHLIANLRQTLSGNVFWRKKLAPALKSTFVLHLAVFREPYLQFILDGKKTVETRFAKRPCPPFQRVKEGDVIMLKRSPGAIVGVCVVEAVTFYYLDSASLALIKSKFGQAICPADSSFWEDRKEASVATLMLIDKVTQVPPFKVEKRDRRGWVVIGGPEEASAR